ncbi:pro-cathepsin H-like [Danaus plexippus]|uniref:pro-cathepsin H-like n=1 Tax=Danaus plexippus TaxID=13037 RepID=UPI002AB0967B|nr:pro-cathepsin H-like [Danaus plexippus]
MIAFILKIFPLLIVASVAGKNVLEDDLPKLKWPKKYSFEAESLSLTSGLVEDVTYWRVSKKSRVDFNKGAVKLISIKGQRKSKFPFGVKYEIHPESNEEYENKFICTGMKGNIFRQAKLDKVLPDVDDFVHIGKEKLELGEVEKFTFFEDKDYINSQTRQNLWVLQNDSTFIPVRYEKIVYNTWIKNVKDHTIWNIFNFKTDFSEDVFDIDDYDCKINSPKNNNENEEVDSDESTNLDSDHVFAEFMQKHNKNYDGPEHEQRRKIFETNLRKIEEHNRSNKNFKLAINKFADLTHKEMEKRKGLKRRGKSSGAIPFPYSKSKIAEMSDTLPKEYDARMYGLVTSVKDQQDCGSCWTFGTTSAVEGALARINGGRLMRLANQALIDCAWGYENFGCDGGTDTGAYHWMLNYGMPTEEEYGPYVNKDGFCRIHNMTQTYKIKGFTNVTPYSVEALKVALVNHGPLSVSIDATDMLTYYNGGIYSDSDCSTTNLNHEVTLVGYGELDGEEYWIVKNSWGRDWGVDGYFHITTRDNSCGITTEPTYVVF